MDAQTVPTSPESIDRNSPTVDVVAWCKEAGLHQAELVGRWVWVSFPAKPEAATRARLIAAGFRWVKRRAAWAHSCGIRSRKSPHNPKDKYGAIGVDELEIDRD